MAEKKAVTFSSLKENALKIGLLPKDFYRMNLVEYCIYQEGYYERLQLNNENDWEQSRLIAALIYNTNSPKNKQIKVEDIRRLKIDELILKEKLRKAKIAKEQFKELQKKEGKLNG